VSPESPTAVQVAVYSVVVSAVAISFAIILGNVVAMHRNTTNKRIVIVVFVTIVTRPNSKKLLLLAAVL
jgi:hypothetical protein